MNALHEYMSDLFNDCLALSIAKNHDYAGDEDPLKNFNKSPEFGVTVSQGIMVRLSDKWSRLEGFFGHNGELLVEGETVFDTIMDIINYSGILAYVQSLRNTVEARIEVCAPMTEIYKDDVGWCETEKVAEVKPSNAMRCKTLIEKAYEDSYKPPLSAVQEANERGTT